MVLCREYGNMLYRVYRHNGKESEDHHVGFRV